MKPLLMSVTCNRKAPSKVLNLFKDASAQLKEAFKNASWQEKQKDSLLEHKTDNIVRLKKEEREGNMELEQLEQELEGLREEMKLLEEEEKALRRMELSRKGSEVGEGVDRNLHPGNLNNSESFKGTYIHEDGTLADSPSLDIQRKTSVLKGESGSRRSSEKLPFTNKPSNFDFLQVHSSLTYIPLAAELLFHWQMKTPQAWFKNKTGFQR